MNLQALFDFIAFQLYLTAERKGFEPLVPVRVQRFSRPPRSTTPASFLISLQIYNNSPDFGKE